MVYSRYMDSVKHLAANNVVCASLLAGLVSALVVKGVLSDGDVKEIYEHALLMIEEEQAAADAQVADMYAAAREVIEEHLRPADRGGIVKPPL